MCGIGGVVLSDRRKHFDKPTQILSVALLHELQDRGSEAWGVYLRNIRENSNLNCGEIDDTLDGELFKTVGPVDEFFKEGKVDLSKAQLMLMHTRQSTQGSPKVNTNNHPFSTKDFVLSHNGNISNANTIRKEHKIDTKIECDSYVIVALIQKFYDENGNDVIKAIKSAAKEIKGGFACWLYYKKDKDIYLFKHNNPMSYYVKKDKIFFASTSRHIAEIMEDVYSSDTTDLAQDTIYKIEGNKVEEIDTFNTSSEMDYSGYGTSSYNNPRLNSNRSSELKVDEVDKSLLYLFEKFEEYENSSRPETVIAITRNAVVLLVRPKELIEELDKHGFGKYRDADKLYQSNFHKYRITPPININKLVRNLKGEENSEDRFSVDNIDMKKYTDMSKDDLVGFFWGNVSETLEILDLPFEYDESTDMLTIGSEKDTVPEYITNLFEKIGMTLSNKKNMTSFKLSRFHLLKMAKLYEAVEGDLGE